MLNDQWSLPCACAVPANREYYGHTGRMVLTPVDPRACPDHELLVEILLLEDFIASPPGMPGRTFDVGQNFLSFIRFAHSQTNASLHDPDMMSAMCRVRLPPSSARMRLWYGRSTSAPHCMVCDTPFPDWQKRIAHWRNHRRAGFRCPGCATVHPPWRWNWRGRGGFGRMFLLIEEIYPDAAQPDPAFMNLLQKTTGTAWQYFFVQD